LFVTVANKLAQVLRMTKGGADAVFVRMFDMHVTTNQVHMQYTILDLINEFDTDIVVYMYKLEDKLQHLFDVSNYEI
jgi:hypothetical protein